MAVLDFRERRRRWPIIAVVAGGAVVVLLITSSWLAASVRSVYTELTAGRDDLLSARAALGATDLKAARESFSAAAAHASKAASEVRGPLWNVAAATPGLGATPKAVRAVASSLDQALFTLTPAVSVIGSLDPNELVGAEGAIDLAGLQSAVGRLASAREGLEAASRTLAAAPSRAAGDRVVPSVDDAATELAEQLSELDHTLDTTITTANIALPLLGSEGPKRYFVGVLNPNEARGTGGFLGTFVILQANSGRVTVEHIGSNSELPTLQEVPKGLGQQYLARYGEDPRLVANMNISPHFPAAARLWLESWKVKTGETLDGVLAADVVALGNMVTATGQSVKLPGGVELTGEELTEFAISGIYEEFPQPGDKAQRKAFQEQLTTEAFDLVKESPNRAALASAIGAALAERRIQLWSADDALQASIVEAGVSGSLRVPNGHWVAFAAINASGSKLDAYLSTSVSYEVGRCPMPGTERAQSQVMVRLNSDIPEGEDIPEYMISLAERGPDGPINSTLAQFHLPLGAEIVQVDLDGQSVGYVPFREQDRPSLVLAMDLAPRVGRKLVVTFLEPAAEGPGFAPAQPLVNDPDSTVINRDCSTPAQ